MTDEEKQKKKQKIEENRARRMGDSTEESKSPTFCERPISPFYSNPFHNETGKPQAVVIGTVRSERESSVKVKHWYFYR